MGRIESEFLTYSHKFVIKDLVNSQEIKQETKKAIHLGGFFKDFPNENRLGEPCVDVSEQENQAKYIVRQNYIAVKINMTYSVEITSKRDLKGRFC